MLFRPIITDIDLDSSIFIKVLGMISWMESTWTWYCTNNVLGWSDWWLILETVIPRYFFYQYDLKKISKHFEV